MSKPSFHTATLSRAGGRAYNEDALGHRNHHWVVADGLGGHRGGEVAARIAIDAILDALPSDSLPTPESLRQVIVDADRAIQDRPHTDRRLDRMRTTVAVLASDGAQAIWAHVGDTRVYHFRDYRVLFQTADHSVPQAMAKAGEIRPAEIRFHEDRNRLLRTLGGGDDVRPEVTVSAVPLQPGDAFLLCTDGVWEYVTETEMEVTLAKATGAEDWLRAMTSRLLARAESDNDNFTAVAVLLD